MCHARLEFAHVFSGDSHASASVFSFVVQSTVDVSSSSEKGTTALQPLRPIADHVCSRLVCWHRIKRTRHQPVYFHSPRITVWNGGFCPITATSRRFPHHSNITSQGWVDRMLCGERPAPTAQSNKSTSRAISRSSNQRRGFGCSLTISDTHVLEPKTYTTKAQKHSQHSTQ